MEIFRHYYTVQELQGNGFFKKELNDFGFCNLDGSRINYTFTTPSFNIRYSLDTKKQNYLLWSEPIWDSNSRRNITLGNFNVHCSDGSNLRAGDYDRPNDWKYSAATVVFLPLKNNGFLLNIRSPNWDWSVESSITWADDFRDNEFNKSTPTPSLLTKLYSQTNGDQYATSTLPKSGILNYIGIPPCKGNLNWTYLIYTSNSYCGNTRGTEYQKIDFGDGKVLDMPFRSNFIRNFGSSIPAYNELTYTNVNNNVCSMIKLPYDNNYIDGVYLLTTAPQQLEDATFFSFDGRNFLNIFDNYVVELPPST